MKIKRHKMMITGNGINTVTVNGKVKHITELDDITLCLEWTNYERKTIVFMKLITRQTEDGVVSS